jgi:hypothetical protein
MATGDYCTIDELKAKLWPADTIPDDVDDTALARIITAVSKEFNLATGTRFYTTASDETRYFTAKDGSHCWIDQFTSVTSVATDDSADRTYGYTWTAANDYELYPLNASQYGEPYYRIDRKPLGNYAFPTASNAVKVVGKFGYDTSVTAATTISVVRDAVLLQCEKVFKAAPLGVLGPTEAGQVAVIPGWHPDVLRVIRTLKVNYT